MSDFKEYKPVEPEYNVQAAVENMKKAYWSNEPGKFAKIFSDAEAIIISAICHHGYTLCKETTEGDCISREALKAKMFDIPKPKEGSTFWDGVDTVGNLIDNAPTVPQINIFCENADEKAIEDMKAELNGVLNEIRPKGEWIDDSSTSWKCSCCGYGVNRWNNTPFCPNCGACMKKDSAEQ